MKEVFVSNHLGLNKFLHKFHFFFFFSSKRFCMFAGTLYQEKIKEAHMENSLQFFGEKG